jgi:hypothetical protein
VAAGTLTTIDVFDNTTNRVRPASPFSSIGRQTGHHLVL